MALQTSDWLSAFALVIAGGALALEVRRWFETGPRLRLSLMADAETYPPDDGKPKLILHVTNRGDTPTTLTHMVTYRYRSIFHRWLKKQSSAGIVLSPAVIAGMENPPVELGVNKVWHGAMAYKKELT